MEPGADHPPWHQDQSPEAYQRLRALARALMRFERRDHTLTPTALVHEAVLRAATGAAPGPRLVMKRVLLDHARGRARLKRQPVDGHRQPLEPEHLAAPGRSTTVVSIQEALHRLRAASPERALAWEQFHFDGLPTEEIARVRGVSQRSVQLWLRAANAFLRACLAGQGD